MIAVITMKKQPWSGRNPELLEAKEVTLEVKEGETLDESKTSFKAVSIKVESISQSSVTLITSGLVEPNVGGGINLMKDSKNLQVILEKDTPLTLVTQTMDAGVRYTLTLNQIKEKL